MKANNHFSAKLSAGNYSPVFMGKDARATFGRLGKNSNNYSQLAMNCRMMLLNRGC